MAAGEASVDICSLLGLCMACAFGGTFGWIVLATKREVGGGGGRGGEHAW